MLKMRFIVFSLLPGCVALGLSYVLPLNSIIIGLLLGVLLGNLLSITPPIQKKIKKTGNHFLEFSVVLLAFGGGYAHLSRLGWKSLTLIVLLVLLVLVITYLISKKPLDWLIGFGTAICGTSAIAALAPFVSKSDSDTGVAVAVINLFGTLGMLGLPLLLLQLDWTPVHEALVLGGGLHSVGNVAGAGYMISQQTGDLALTVKLARVTLLPLGLIFFSVLHQKNSTEPHRFFKMPWYVWAFIAVTIFVSLVSVTQSILEVIGFLGKILLTLAMANLGMLIRFKDLIQSGKKGLLFGLWMFLIQLAVLALLLYII